MRRVLALLILLAACASPPALADPLEGAHPELLQSCIDTAGNAREALHQCVGALARPCIREEGQSTMATVLCWSAESEHWRTLVDEGMRRLVQTEPDLDPARLAAADTAWRAWLEAECEYWAYQEGGGSGEQVDRVMCAARVTAVRAIDLRLAAAS